MAAGVQHHLSARKQQLQGPLVTSSQPMLGKLRTWNEALIQQRTERETKFREVLKGRHCQYESTLPSV